MLPHTISLSAKRRCFLEAGKSQPRGGGTRGARALAGVGLPAFLFLSCPLLSAAPHPLLKAFAPRTRVWLWGRGSRREGGAKEGAITLLVSLNDGSPVSVHRFLAPSYVHKFLCMGELIVPHCLQRKGPLTSEEGTQVFCLLRQISLQPKRASNLLCSRGWP